MSWHADGHLAVNPWEITMPGRSRSAERTPRYRMRLRVVMNRGSAFTRDIGPGGFCAEMMRVLEVGTQVEGMIYFDGGDRLFTGRVAWARAGDFRMGLTGRMGVGFQKVDADLARGLAARGTASTPDVDPGGGGK